MIHSSTNQITSLYKHENRVKYYPSLLDKASRYFETNIGQKYGYKIIKIIDISGLRIVVAEDGNRVIYAISLIIIQGSHNDINHLTLSDIGRITKHIAYENNAIACSCFVELG